MEMGEMVKVLKEHFTFDQAYTVIAAIEIAANRATEEDELLFGSKTVERIKQLHAEF
jgi:hypothetical protein